MFARLRKLLRRKPKPSTYVIIYDVLDAEGETATEEYYGYFSSPDEARLVWGIFDNGSVKMGNVKLCLVVDSWESADGFR
ncbi:hypothetical protein [Sphingomonas sp. 3-13AW]|uniref:hypothetical protein n=1 Tax=Sphingomonas sp. 3-13AW TaxID=3050450 RepID=UPI003BB584A2